MNTSKLEMEEKQEIMAQVITDLEMRNTQLEDRLNQTKVRNFHAFKHSVIIHFYNFYYPLLLKPIEILTTKASDLCLIALGHFII